ncbi:hypothetical protein JCM11491_001732 [Sporobolomyces phaffii]
MGLSRLVGLSTLMLVSTVLASFAPLYLDLSPRRVALVSTYSTGILVGAALSIIVPEGVAAVFRSLDRDRASTSDHDDATASAIGASLVAGFILMFIIDSWHSHQGPPPPPLRRHPPLRHMPSHLSELEPLSPPRTSDQDSLDPDWTPLPIHDDCDDDDMSSSASSSARSTLIGLLLHSLADGISLGASSVSSSPSSGHEHEHGHGHDAGSSLSGVVFLAIMLHKAPTAFALSNLLRTANASRTFLHRALVLFALAAPVGAISTYVALSLVGGSHGGDGGRNLEWYTGIALVFSGGTFLFVATRAVATTTTRPGGGGGRDHDHDAAAATGGDGSSTRRDDKIGPRLETGLVLAGMVTPGILSRLVGHGH